MNQQIIIHASLHRKWTQREKGEVYSPQHFCQTEISDEYGNHMRIVTTMKRIVYNGQELQTQKPPGASI